MDRYRGFDINSLRQQMEDLFDDFFTAGSPRRPSGGRPAEAEQAQPLPLNVIETEGELVILAPLPGLTPDDIEISVRAQTLTLKAQRRDPFPERRDYLRREWGYGPYQRTVELSMPVDADRAHASFKHGVVTLTLPKADTSRPRTIKLDDDSEGDTPEEETTASDTEEQFIDVPDEGETVSPDATEESAAPAQIEDANEQAGASPEAPVIEGDVEATDPVGDEAGALAQAEEGPDVSMVAPEEIEASSLTVEQAPGGAGGAGSTDPSPEAEPVGEGGTGGYEPETTESETTEPESEATPETVSDPEKTTETPAD